MQLKVEDSAVPATPAARTVSLTAMLMPADEGGFVALNPETGVCTQGETVEEAMAMLKEATELYLEECPEYLEEFPNHNFADNVIKELKLEVAVNAAT